MKERRPLRADDPVECVVGIGPKTAGALHSIGIRTVDDLLFHLPRRYEDRGRVVAVDEACRTGATSLCYGRLTVRIARYVRRRLHIADGELTDTTGSVAVRWFNQPWIAKRLKDGADGYVYGRAVLGKNGRLQLVNPEIEIEPRSSSRDLLVPIYPKLGPLTGKRLAKVMDQALGCVEGIADPLPAWIRDELELPTLAETLDALHKPPLPEESHRRVQQVEDLNAAASPGHRRLAFDELLAVSTVVAGTRARRFEQKARPIRVPYDFSDTCRRILPFTLTSAQRRAVNEIIADLGRSVPMARLLQGDVGSGKTAVAVLAILAMITAGRQVALMAPTELLAEQLHRWVASTIGAIGHRVRLLTGSMSVGDARARRTALAAGEIDVVVGTHALFQQDVTFADLGLVVIDEQHRFGVTQRQSLLDKGTSPHLLVMTATPIPRSLALTLYGDLDLTLIDELPPGRRPIRTEVRGPSSRERILDFLRSEIATGGQGYIVYPMIESSDKIAAAALEEQEAQVRRALGDIEIGVLHGRLDRKAREKVADGFRDGDLKVVLATTVIEVGVDVPAASVMIVESADRFGLSQLHQLRGRVGRGDRPSWCILVTGDAPSEDARRRLGVLEETTDGFEIAEADLRHRGPGELTGVRQWGAESFRFADLIRHQDLVIRSRGIARKLADRGCLEEVRELLLRRHPVGENFSIG